uniref:Angiomotin C-terminal domain-containing protein n=1 Tax=Parascaris univalens TaxID=6257 RepID=A0A915BY13_PARUN
MDEERREMRSWSIEPRDRRVHAVSPMHLHEGRLLSSLLHEAHNISASNNKINSQANGNDKEQLDDAQLQQMIDKYQSQVLQQQQRITNHGNHEIIRSFASPSSSATPQMPPMSHSQPCLITVADQKNELMGESAPPSYPHASSSKETAEPRENASLKAKLLSSQKLLTALQEENASLKQQCEFLKKKSTRLQQLESAYETIEREYENLTAQKERQDNLEKAVRAKLEKQIARYAAENEMLHERVDELTQRLQIEPQADQLNKLNLILNEMIPQNKELLACKERQKMDIEALEVTLKDQRNHIQILEKALSNAQEKVWRKEKEVEELTAGAERAAALQRAVEKSVLDKQKREEEWSRERSQLEMENAQLKMQLAKESVTVGVKKGAATRSPDSEETVAKLKKALHAKDDRIMQLEKSVIELETRFHEEMQRNKMAIATQSDTLSGKLKKMEEEKSEKDRKIAELTEEKERLTEKLEDERKTSENRANLLQREIDRIRTGDERRFREDMARMEQMRLKIADRRCFTTDRVRNRFNNHGRTSSGSRVTPVYNHARTHSASALLSCELDGESQSTDAPLDLSSGSGPSMNSSPFLHTSSYKEIDFIGDSPSEELYKSSLSNRYSSRPMQIPSRYDVPFASSEGILSRIPTRINDPAPKEPNVDKKDPPKEIDKGKSGEEVWNV